MSIIASTILVCIGILLFFVTLILARGQQKHWWESELMTSSLYVPAVIGFFLIGAIQLIKFFFVQSQSLTIGSVAVSAIIGIATFLIIKSMGIKKRLARYEQLSSDAKVVEMPAPPTSDKHDSPPAKAA